jgi:hypothetical protein
MFVPFHRFMLVLIVAYGLFLCYAAGYVLHSHMIGN